MKRYTHKIKYPKDAFCECGETFEKHIDSNLYCYEFKPITYSLIKDFEKEFRNFLLDNGFEITLENCEVFGFRNVIQKIYHQDYGFWEFEIDPDPLEIWNILFEEDKIKVIKDFVKTLIVKNEERILKKNV